MEGQTDTQRTIKIKKKKKKMKEDNGKNLGILRDRHIP